MGRRGISLLRLFIVLTLSVVFLTAQVFAEDAETQTDSEETTAPAVATVENEPKTEIVTVKEETKAEEAQVDLQKQEEKEKSPEGVELEFLSARAEINKSREVRITLKGDQIGLLRFKDGKVPTSGLFDVMFEITLQKEPYEFELKGSGARIENGELVLDWFLVNPPVPMEYTNSRIKVKYMGKGHSSELMIGDQPVKNHQDYQTISLDQSDYESKVKFEKAVVGEKRFAQWLKIIASDNMKMMKASEPTEEYRFPMKWAVAGFSIQPTDPKSAKIEIKSLEYVEDKEIKLELSREVIYGEKFTILYDPRKVLIDDYKLKDATPYTRYIVKQEIEESKIENLAEPILIHVDEFKVAEPFKKGQEGKATIKLSSPGEVDFSKFILEQEELKLEGASLVRFEKQKGSDDLFDLTFKDLQVEEGKDSRQIILELEKLGYKFDGNFKTTVQILATDSNEPNMPEQPKPIPKPEPNPEPVPPPVPNPDKEQDPKKPEDNNVQNQGGGSARSSVRPDAAAATTIKEEPAPKAPSPESKNANSVITLKIGSKEYQVMENGELVTKMMDVAPKVHKGATLLPARMIADILGVNIKYDAATKKVSFSYNEGNEAQLTLGENFMMIHGERMELTSESMIENGRVLLPLGDVQKAFSKIGLEAKIAWNADAKTITIER